MASTAETAGPRNRARGGERQPRRTAENPYDEAIVSDRASSDDSISLPETPRGPSLVETLTREFAGSIEPDVVERAAAAARHALERSRVAATPAAVERLVRDQLHRRLSRSRHS